MWILWMCQFFFIGLRCWLFSWLYYLQTDFICFAIYQERRLATLRELVRLLRPGGRALIYVWAMEQEYNKQKSKYLKEKKANKGKVEEINSNSARELLENSSCQDPAYLDDGISQIKGRCCEANQAALPKLPVHTNRTSFGSQDLLVPWHLKGGTKATARHVQLNHRLASSANSHEASPVFHRYYHVFCEGELELVCRSLDCIKVQESYYDQGNWCVVLEKQISCREQQCKGTFLT